MLFDLSKWKVCESRVSGKVMTSVNLQSIFDLNVFSDQPALLVAEISANHDKDLSQALDLLQVAADSGWHCVKLQTYTADSLTMNSEHSSMKIDPIWGYANLHELYSAAAMPMEFHEPLFARARELGLVPFTSIYDPKDIAFLENMHCEIYKIASFELTFDDLLIEVASTNKPIILSTGMADLREVEHAVNLIQKSGSSELVILHCCSAYPAPHESIHLNAMLAMREHFNLPIGFSDHTIDSSAALAAVSMGAKVIEKHFTNDPTRDGPDHRFSATSEVLKEISDGVRTIGKLMGDSVKQTTPEECENKIRGRRSAFATRDLRPGTVISAGDFRFIRPGVGIPANQKHRLLGQKLDRQVLAGHPITPSDLS